MKDLIFLEHEFKRTLVARVSSEISLFPNEVTLSLRIFNHESRLRTEKIVITAEIHDFHEAWHRLLESTAQK